MSDTMDIPPTVVGGAIGAALSAVGGIIVAVIHYLRGEEQIEQRIAAEVRDDLREDYTRMRQQRRAAREQRDHWQERAEECHEHVDKLERKCEKLSASVSDLQTESRQLRADLDYLKRWINESSDITVDPDDLLKEDLQ